MDIQVSLDMNKREAVKIFNQKLKGINKYLYCSFDYINGFYKVYKTLPFELWGKLGDFDGEGYCILTIKTASEKPRLPHSMDLLTIRGMEMKQVPYSARVDNSWKKYKI